MENTLTVYVLFLVMFNFEIPKRQSQPNFYKVAINSNQLSYFKHMVEKQYIFIVEFNIIAYEV